MLHNLKLHNKTLLSLDGMPAYTYIIDMMYPNWEQNTYPSSVDVGLGKDKLD